MVRRVQSPAEPAPFTMGMLENLLAAGGTMAGLQLVLSVLLVHVFRDDPAGLARLRERCLSVQDSFYQISVDRGVIVKPSDEAVHDYGVEAIEACFPTLQAGSRPPNQDAGRSR